MTALRRQQLVRLSGAGWSRVLDAPWDAGARACLDMWAARGLPLVVTRQPAADDDAVATGLPAPARFRRRRLALRIALREILFFDEFPPAEAATRLLPRTVAPAWRALLASLASADCAPRVYGGYGWQTLTRLAYIHADSDLDLLLPVDSAAQADEVGRVLASADGASPFGVRSLLLHDAALPDGVMPDGVRSLLLHDFSRESSILSLAEERPDPALQGKDGSVDRAPGEATSERDARGLAARETMQKERPDPETDVPKSEQKAMWAGPRLDGELVFPDGAAIAWREWVAHREGRAAQVLVKRLRGVALESPGACVA